MMPWAALTASAGGVRLSALCRFWKNLSALPAQQQPFDASVYSAGEEGERFLEQVMTIYRERQQSGAGGADRAS